jgi:diguanylate cyclase (GGDEF)-like protein
MQKIPVTRDGKRGSEILLIDSADIIKIDVIKDRDFLVHTKDGQYYLVISLDSIEELLFEDGFRMLDSTNLVNMNHVSEYDYKRGIVYLDENRKEAKTASAARIHKDHIEKVMQMLTIARENELEGIYDTSREEKLDFITKQPGDERFTRSYDTIRAVTEKKWAEEKIHYMAYHDLLTELPNRASFQLKLKQSFELAQQDGTMLAVIFLDLDRIKLINDTLGHHVGDELLKYTARRLKRFVREEDTVARFGGDEFIILLNQMRHVDEAAVFAKAIPQLFQEPFQHEQHELYITSSIGISIYPNDGEDIDTLIANADVAMYRAKEKGGNTYQFYHSDMNLRSLERLNMETQLRKALERGEIEVHYQPLVELQDGRIFGMESLMRWNHPKLGMISPGEFIPVAEETGLIVPIGNWVLEESCRVNKRWNDLGYGPLCISVNISVHQFQQPNFLNFVRDTLAESGLDPSLLCLEITENVAMKNVSYMIETMSKLKQLGIRISIDDFGTGYSSLSYLKRFRVHTLKIDQSFIRDLTRDEDNEAIVTALIAMSHKLKIKSLAEGVESQEQLDFLREHGCDEIQGYVFSKPLPEPDFEQIIRENKSLYPLQ